MERVFSGVFIPSKIYLSKDLSAIERFFLVEIESLSTDDVRGCYAGNRHFAERFDLSLSRSSEIVSSLEGRGYVSVTLIRSGKQVVERRIFLTRKSLDLWVPTPSENTANPFGKHGEPPSENTQEKITTLKITIEDNLSSDFADFWQQYPRKIAKPKAEKAYARAVKKTPPGEILSGLMVWKMYWDDPQFIPHPATWLNDERWNDAPPEKRNERNNPSQQSAGRSTAYLGIALGNLAQGNSYPTGEYGP